MAIRSNYQREHMRVAAGVIVSVIAGFIAGFCLATAFT